MDKQNMSEFVTLQDAAQMAGLPLEMLTTLVQTGKIRAARFNGEVLISVSRVKKARQRIDKTRGVPPFIDRTQFRYMEGQRIRCSMAAAKYNIGKSTLSTWVKKEHIRVLSREAKTLMLDESDVAYALALANANGGVREGKWTFHGLRSG